MPKKDAILLFLLGLLLSPLVPKNLEDWRSHWQDGDKRTWLVGGITVVAIIGIVLYIAADKE